MWFVVHTSAFTTHKSAIPENLWFIENFNSDIVKSLQFGWGIWQVCHCRARTFGS